MGNRKRVDSHKRNVKEETYIYIYIKIEKT